MKKIGIYTWFYSVNYGTSIQAYALYRFLKNKNYNVKIVENLKFYYGLSHPIDSIVTLLKKYYRKCIKHPNSAMQLKDLKISVQKKYEERMQKNKNFAYLHNEIISNKSKKDYEQMLSDVEIFITGSDQIWNPNYIMSINLLAFAPKHKKIAYASSIGVDKIPLLKRNFYKKYLSRFYKIGVREKTAQIELSKLLNKEVVTVLDPTFLLNKEEWTKIINKEKCEPLPNNKYIFCYFIGKNRDWEKQVKNYAEQNGYEVYCAPSESYIIPEVGISKPELGAEDFINYLMNADIIATDSFHAVALSINFNKNFAVFKRFKDTDKKSQNSRIVDVLSTFKLSNQLIQENNKLKKALEKDIDYSETNNILKELRNYSEKFLINAIESED